MLLLQGFSNMIENDDVALWLDISGALFRVLLPEGAGFEICGHGMDKDVFADLVDRESWRVDHALESMAEASGQTEVLRIIAQLDKDTLIALFSRWTNYTCMWSEYLHHPHSPLWMPPDQKDLWRAVLLAMTSEGLHSSGIARRLWPELCGEPPLKA